MRLATPRSIVRWQLNEEHLTRPRLDRALRLAAMDGWVWGYQPSVRHPDRTLPIVRLDDLVAPLLSLTREAAAAGGDAIAVVPRQSVENEIGYPIEDPYAGTRLGNYGLVIQDVIDDQVQLIGTHPEIARTVNETRYPRKRQRRRDVAILVQAARCDQPRAKRISVNARIETAQAYEWFRINVDEILEGKRHAYVTSEWVMPESPNGEDTGAAQAGAERAA